jgi:ActR/RegA family two-component response regulator
LECPVPHCLYDVPRGKKQWLKELRNEEIQKLSSAGWNVKDLALLFGVCRRTIHRALGKK